MSKHVGECHLCGDYGPLSFEHVPPRSAFNDRPVVLVEFNKAFGLLPDDPIPKGRISQRGAGGYTLCGDCNSKTGRWYGNEFAQWCYQAAELLMRSEGKPSLIYGYHLHPLRVIKQIITMFFSVNGSGFQRKHPDLVEFILSKERRFLPEKYGVWVYYNYEGRLRYQSGAVTWDIGEGRHWSFSEITFPPFGYVLTLDSEPPSRELFPIRHFGQYGFDDFRTMQLQPPVLPTYLIIPGDYRTKEEIQEHLLRQEHEDADIPVE